MDQRIIDFLNEERIACLTTILKDGSPHAAALHFSHTNDPLKLYFSTENTSRKCGGLLEGELVKGSVVVGFSEKEFKTFQMDGAVSIVSGEELESARAVHYGKYPDSAKYKDNPATVILKFIPDWWRYSDYKSKPEKTVLSSEQ